MDYNGDTANQSNGNRHKRWYQKTIWIILWLIVFFPVGIFLMWRYANWKKPVKIVISAVFAFFIYSGFTSSKLESINIQADTETVYDINEQIQIKQVVQPDNHTIAATAYKTTGGKVKSSDSKVFFTNDEPGTYEVYAEASGIKSNTLTFKIEDKTAISEEKAKKEAAARKKAKEEAAKKAEEERIAAEAEAQKKAEEEAAAKKEEERIAAEAAAKKAEEERIAVEAAAQQAEQERIASEQAAAQAQQPQEQMVWISATGSKYHSYSSCGNMNPDNAYQMTQAEAEASGYGRCKKCH